MRQSLLFEECFSTVLQLLPDLADFVESFFLGDFAIALQGNNQPDTLSELLKILVKGQPLRGPVITAIT